MSTSFRLLRPDDLLALNVETINLKLDKDRERGPALVLDKVERPAFIIFTFPPQSIVEGAYYEAAVVKPDGKPGTTDADQPVPPPAKDHLIDTPVLPGHLASGQKAVAEFAHPSRLVFRVGATARIPFTIEGLLDWASLSLNVNPIAAIGPAPTAEQIAAAPDIRRPSATETAIEMPYRLVISPGANVAWDHRKLPFFHDGRCELWHTRLFGRSATGPAEPSHDSPLPLRAIWSDDFDPANPLHPAKSDPDLGRTAMSPNDRSQIVVLTSAFHGYQADYDLFHILSEAVLAARTKSAAPVAAPVDARLRVPDSLSLLPRPWPTTRTYVPEPFFAEQLFLSPLGGWLKSRGQWDPLPRKAPPVLKTRPEVGALVAHLDTLIAQTHAFGQVRIDAAVPLDDRLAALRSKDATPPIQLDLSEWVHAATQGRDHYVRIVYEGELWPFRHKAALIKVTERKFITHHDIVEAHLVQRNFIVVRQPEVQFGPDSRAIPFKRVRLTTMVTPSIAEPSLIGTTNRSFWVEMMTGGASREKFHFHGVGGDVTGADVDFTAPLVFVSVSDLADPAKMAQVRDAYNAKAEIAERTIDIPGQKLCFAPGKVGTSANDNTRLVTRTLNFVVDKAGNPPRMLMAEVNIPQVQQLLQTDAATTIRFFADYVDKGIDDAANKTGVFAEIVKQDLSAYLPDNPFAGLAADTLGVAFSSDKAGGFATPNLGVSNLTSVHGPLAGKVAKAVTDAFDPSDFFPKDGLAQLFGSFDLADLLPVSSMGENAPKLQTTSEDIPGGKKLVVTIDWTPKVQNVDLGIAAFVKDHNGVSKLEIHGRIEKPFKLDAPPAGADATSTFSGKLNDFQVSVLKSVFVNFDGFSFTSKSGSKPDVTVALNPAKPVEFAGDLQFVEELRKAIPPGLFGDGPSLDISPTGIRAGFDLALPPLSIGVFALKDIRLGAALTLPFLNGKPTFDFNVSERCHPFQLAIAFFAGGGFFHLQLDTAGMKQLEAALEFGAAASIDIGVASGEVHIMAGIYFSLQRKEGTTDLACTLTGYLRMGGSLDVLGIIKVSVEFNLSFTYKSEPGGSGKAYGRATLTVQVEVLFFSASVELTVEKSFGGSSGDPHFLDEYDTDGSWKEYALAFA